MQTGAPKGIPCRDPLLSQLLHPEQLLPCHPSHTTLLPLHFISRWRRVLCWPKSGSSCLKPNVSADVPGTPSIPERRRSCSHPSPAGTGAAGRWLDSPGRPEVHQQVAVVDSWHPHQLLVLCHRVPVRRRERLQVRELGLQNQGTQTWQLLLAQEHHSSQIPCNRGTWQLGDVQTTAAEGFVPSFRTLRMPRHQAQPIPFIQHSFLRRAVTFLMIIPG